MRYQPYFRLPGMTIRYAIGLWCYNNIKVPWKNHSAHWGPLFFYGRLFRLWCSEGRDPKMFPRIGKIGPAAMKWAMEAVRHIDESPRDDR